MKTLEMGYNSNEKGISFDEVVEKLKIDISNEDFEINFVIWFYSNFYNNKVEPKILGLNTASNSNYYLNKITYRDYKQYNASKSYIKGDALNRYIVKRTRRSSMNATYLAFASLFIALLSIVIPIVFPNYFKPQPNEIVPEYRNESQQHEQTNSPDAEAGTKDMHNSQTDTATKLDSIN
ncbi:hypothetical protein [Wocania ichthyoenteri]|uniref:hypothetical protein n=1 Tax=Wocania ichthyoenteri TaxID=1230531 RepID=UPI0012E07E39|nr:hypothetical protein [Wocania ichthyoenteri]